MVKKDYDVIAVYGSKGGRKGFGVHHNKALKGWGCRSYVIDVKEEFANDYVLSGPSGTCLLRTKYLVSALSRPLITKKLVEIAHQLGGNHKYMFVQVKGSDQVRFEVSICSFGSQFKVFAPVREWKWSHEEEINMPKKTVFQFCDLGSPYSIDRNL